MSFKIGNIEIKGKAILAPMAGYTNRAFFHLAYNYGASLLVSEMISDKGLIYNNDRTVNLLDFYQDERPFSVQLFGNDKDELVEAGRKVIEIAHPDIIDINMGCSVPKIYKNGSGSALLKDPKKIGEIVKAMVSNLDVPITIKIRSGINHQNVNCFEVAKEAEMAGCSAIVLHPRTKSDLFKGSPDMSLVKLLKDNLNIPVIASGDIKTPEDAKRVLDETGCDAVMIGRAALGNPFLFKQINDYLETGSYTTPTLEERFDALSLHIDELIKLKGEKVAVLEARSICPPYVKGMKGGVFFKKELLTCKTEKELKDLISEYKKMVIND